MEKYKISNMKSEINQVMFANYFSRKPVENAMRVEASLEDVFLYYFGEKAGDENLCVMKSKKCFLNQKIELLS